MVASALWVPKHPNSCSYTSLGLCRPFTYRWRKSSSFPALETWDLCSECLSRNPYYLVHNCSPLEKATFLTTLREGGRNKWVSGQPDQPWVLSRSPCLPRCTDVQLEYCWLHQAMSGCIQQQTIRQHLLAKPWNGKQALIRALSSCFRNNFFFFFRE